MKKITDNENIILGSGCFWCTEAVFQRIKGVKEIKSGYAGGHAANPTYRDVCDEITGHAEVVRVSFDPNEVGLEKILEVFWASHDPTTLNQQGYDKGTQYRSIILCTNPEQLVIAKASMQTAQSDFKNPIVTEVKPLEQFWPAEAQHHDYYNQHGSARYCALMITPKLKKLGL